MALTNTETKEINCKIVYFGPRGAGKTANLRAIFNNTSADIRSGMVELAESTGPTPFFDFLPISLGYVKDFHLKLHLFTIPSNRLYESVPHVILHGIDGFVFVADSRVEALGANIEQLAAVEKMLAEENVNVTELPRVFQYNKRDVDDIVSADILRQELNRLAFPDHEAIATKSLGTMETIHSMAKLILRRLAP